MHLAAHGSLLVETFSTIWFLTVIRKKELTSVETSYPVWVLNSWLDYRPTGTLSPRREFVLQHCQPCEGGHSILAVSPLAELTVRSLSCVYVSNSTCPNDRVYRIARILLHTRGRNGLCMPHSRHTTAPASNLLGDAIDCMPHSNRVCLALATPRVPSGRRPASRLYSC